ncbi:Metal homeostatis protein BSD2 [Mycena venus]|uniref:Metal homeostatis protein BSD2 n=1 Tax=Mycena venus TaxID=2733690 RepID=A0A8H6WXB8_9AGAR|nr:Metal homeostatis protein BSD2 [Mycena venus]
MSVHYTPLPSRSAQDADSELDDAFGDDEDTEDTPLNPHSQQVEVPVHVPGAYDFEREYDCPPPGSPPRPSALALPNNFGNSNGRLPTEPVIPPAPRSSFFRRAVGAILPTHYTRLPGSDPTASVAGVRGGGIENDGVFANVMAKPQRARTMRTEDGEIHMVPEDNQKEPPPSYAAAQADSVPPYWETTVHAPGMDLGSDMIIDDLPSGSVWVFLVNMFISFFFQFVGFLLTFLLHTSHAAKYGSRAGLGLTLIQYGFYSRAGGVGEGWFLLLSSFIGFWRIKRWESSIRASSTPITAEDIERDAAVRRNIENVFGFSFGDEERGDRRQPVPVRRDENGTVVVIPTQELLEEARLARDLRAAGLL